MKFQDNLMNERKATFPRVGPVALSASSVRRDYTTPPGLGYSLKRFLNTMYQVPALDFGRRFATAVFERAIPENAVPADDFA